MGKKKTKSSSNETNHSVVVANNPYFSERGVGSVMDAVTGLADADPYGFVAPVNDLERQAGRAAASLGGRAATQIQSLISQGPPTVAAQSLLDGLERYQNPYRDQVVNAAVADFDADAGRTRASQTLDLARQGAFGGSGAALARAQTEGELARARSTQVSKLLSDMFMTSASLSGQDAERRQQAAQANAQLSAQDTQFKAQTLAQLRADERSDATTQAAIGQQLRAGDQATREAPLTLLAKRADIISGLPLGLFKGETTDSVGTSNSTQVTSGATIGEIADLLKTLSSFAGAGSGGAGASSGSGA